METLKLTLDEALEVMGDRTNRWYDAYQRQDPSVVRAVDNAFGDTYGRRPLTFEEVNAMNKKQEGS